MYSIDFENQSGKINICGGIKPLLSPLSVSGLGLPEKQDSVAIFAGQAGQKLVQSRDTARHILITGHVHTDYNEAVRACRILYHPGILTFRIANTVKSIDAVCIGFSDKKIEKNGMFYLEIRFRCDNPYFRHPDTVVKYIYNREGKLKSDFTLPCVISERVTTGFCVNDGDIPAEPVLEVENRGLSACAGFDIVNITTGKSLNYRGEIPSGGKIILSVPARTVTDHLGTDKLMHLKEDCYLSEFSLATGENELVFTALSNDVWCTCRYNVCFVESIL